ncbi:MAG: CBS domain-containing protein [Candidatus Micrarchaeota archaeon]|nr:CBS domain-containing protein [Candidatus Micrarchaeota archaeon]
MMITGEYLKHMREMLGLSQQELARLAKVSQAHIAKIENNKVDPRLSTVNRILSVMERRERRRRCVNFMKKPVFVNKEMMIKDIITIMKKNGISQVPVMNKGKMIGSIQETTLLENVHKGYDLYAGDIMEKPFPVLDYNENIEIAKALLDFSQAVMISKKGNIVGIITRSDLL